VRLLVHSEGLSLEELANRGSYYPKTLTSEAIQSYILFLCQFLWDSRMDLILSLTCIHKQSMHSTPFPPITMLLPVLPLLAALHLSCSQKTLSCVASGGCRSSYQKEPGPRSDVDGLEPSPRPSRHGGQGGNPEVLPAGTWMLASQAHCLR
jgi:hypothetical protein